jgi:hypothetical protein
MNEMNSNAGPNDLDNEIDFEELFNVLWEGKRIIAYLTAFVFIIAVIISLLLPNIYESKALLVPVDSASGISGALGNYSGLAGLAGVSLPVDDEGNSQKALKKIKSLSFFENDILPNIYLPDLMAFKSWDSKTNTVLYDDSIYDTNNNIWVRDYSHPQQQIPSAQESFEVFIEKHLGLSEDKTSGFVTLSIKHKSPFIAKLWAELIIDKVNAFYRQKDKSESEKSVSYLNQQISMTSLSEIKEVMAQLMQEETKKLTLVEANQYYVFDFIDPPAVMEEKSEPKRALISILGFLFGGMLSIIAVLLRYYVLRKKTL